MLRPNMPRKMILPLKPLPKINTSTAGTLVFSDFRSFIVRQRMANEIFFKLECRLALLADVTEGEVFAMSQLVPSVVVSGRVIE